MARTPNNPSGEPPSPESSGRARNLYLIELVLGGALLLLVFAIFFANKTEKKQENAAIVTLTSANWKQEVEDSPVPVVVDFWAPWCGPCRQLSPIIDEVAAHYGPKVKFGKLNVDDAPELAARFGASSIPLVCVFKGGDRPTARLVGCPPDSEERIVNAVEKALE
jgi:thioredoxin 1